MVEIQSSYKPKEGEKMVDHFRLMKVLSEDGGFGVAWIGHDTIKDEIVVVKIFRNMDK
jgi:hypothetical protein